MHEVNSACVLQHDSPTLPRSGLAPRDEECLPSGTYLEHPRTQRALFNDATGARATAQLCLGGQRALSALKAGARVIGAAAVALVSKLRHAIPVAIRQLAERSVHDALELLAQ